MDQEYPFRPRGKHGFDRDDVINYISQAQVRCNEHLAHMEELEVAKNAWYTQAKTLEREKNALADRNRELEDRLAQAPSSEWASQEGLSAEEAAELVALRSRCQELDRELNERNQTLDDREQVIMQQKGLLAEMENRLNSEQAARAEAERLLSAAAEPQQDEALARELEAMQQQNEMLQQKNEFLQQELDMAPIQAENIQTDNSLQLQQENELLQQRMEALQQKNDFMQQELDGLPTMNLDHQETESLRKQVAQLETQIRALEADKATMPALQEHLDNLAQSAEKIAALEAELEQCQADLSITSQEYNAAKAELDSVNTALAATPAAVPYISSVEVEVEGIRAELNATKQALSMKNEAIAALHCEKDALAKRAEALESVRNQTQHKLDNMTIEAENLREKLGEIEEENKNTANKEDALRSMVLSSFNYANLYVDNNLKTAEFISEATSRNIGHVSDSASSLLEQVDAISRTFGETTDNIRRNLTVFQQELGGIQAGMNRRLSKDRFKALLEENDKLRESLENELIAELSTDEETPAIQYEQLQAEGSAQLPFAEDLPNSYHAFLDE